MHTVIWFQVFLSNTNNLHTVVWFQVFLSDTNDYIVSSNYFYLIIVIYFHTVIEANDNNKKQLSLKLFLIQIIYN